MKIMKNSGIPWIKEIPSEWKVSKLIYTLRAKITDGPHETPLLVDVGTPFISVDSLNKTKSVNLDIVKKFISKELYKIYKRKAKLEKGDILFSKAATIGKTAIVDNREFMIWSPLAIIKNNQKIIDNLYLYYVLNCSEYIQHVILMGSYNTQVNVGMRELERSIVPLPPVLDQQIIAHFLDGKCGEIDGLICDIEKEIEILNQYKKSIITETVTKGLNKNIKLKNSGIEWAKHIPEHWEVARIANVYKLRNQKVSDKDFEPLSVTMKGIFPQWENVAKSDAHDDRKLVRKGDFAINSRSDRRGSCGISDRDGSVSLINLVLQPLTNMNPNYYNWLFHTESFADEFYKWGHGIVNDLWTTNWQDMKRILIPQPPIQEQREIAEYLDKKCKEIDSILEDKNKQLETLENYKKSIIYEYVTGKKEVK